MCDVDARDQGFRFRMRRFDGLDWWYEQAAVQGSAPHREGIERWAMDKRRNYTVRADVLLACGAAFAAQAILASRDADTSAGNLDETTKPDASRT